MGNFAEHLRRAQEQLFAGAVAKANPLGKILFVSSSLGNDGNDGSSPRRPVATLTRAEVLADANTTIFALGSFSEAVTFDTAGVKIIGAGRRPKECQWTSGADTVSCTLNANYLEVENIYFKPPAYSAGTPAAIQLSSANHARIHKCRFQGQTASHKAIYSPVCNSDNVEISDCEFHYMNTATHGVAILGVEAGGLSYSAWRIERCKFFSCVTAVNINGRVCLVKDNIFMEYGINAAGSVAAVCTLALDLSGTSSGGNCVTGNLMAGDYAAAGLYKAGASGDVWYGNIAEDTAEAEVGDNAITIGNPA